MTEEERIFARTTEKDFERFWVEKHPRRGFREEDRVYTHFFEEVV